MAASFALTDLHRMSVLGECIYHNFIAFKNSLDDDDYAEDTFNFFLLDLYISIKTQLKNNCWSKRIWCRCNSLCKNIQSFDRLRHLMNCLKSVRGICCKRLTLYHRLPGWVADRQSLHSFHTNFKLQFMDAYFGNYWTALQWMKHMTMGHLLDPTVCWGHFHFSYCLLPLDQSLFLSSRCVSTGILTSLYSETFSSE